MVVHPHDDVSTVAYDHDWYSSPPLLTAMMRTKHHDECVEEASLLLTLLFVVHRITLVILPMLPSRFPSHFWDLSDVAQSSVSC